jgi:hypothetical protein
MLATADLRRMLSWLIRCMDAELTEVLDSSEKHGAMAALNTAIQLLE